MTPPRSKTFRIARASGLTVLAIAALYLIAGNVLLKTRLLRSEINKKPEELVLEYDSAYTLFPGRVKVKGLKLRFQDRNVRFGLALDEATVQIALLELARQRFHATRVDAHGVSWRMLHKVEKVAGQEKRVEAFPRIDGFEWPPVQGPAPEGPPGTGEGVWSVQLDNVEADVRELWMLEYRYVGEGNVVGAFELKPMKTVWVGPAKLELKPGTLSAGAVTVAKNFTLRADYTMALADIPRSEGLLILRPMSASVLVTATLDDLAVAQLYNPELQALGTGTLNAKLEVVNGRVAAGTVIEARLGEMKLRANGAGFNGTVNASLKLAPAEKGDDVPVVHAGVAGTVLVPISKDSAVTANLAGMGADLSLTTVDLAEGPALNWLHARLGEARVDDARAITTAASKKAPVLAPAILGDGPLATSGTADVTADQQLIRVKHARLGDAELSGAALKTGTSWNGAAAGRVAVVPVGLRLKNGSLEVLPFIKEGWLANELGRLGIDPQVSVR